MKKRTNERKSNIQKYMNSGQRIEKWVCSKTLPQMSRFGLSGAGEPPPPCPPSHTRRWIWTYSQHRYWGEKLKEKWFLFSRKRQLFWENRLFCQIRQKSEVQYLQIIQIQNKNAHFYDERFLPPLPVHLVYFTIRVLSLSPMGGQTCGLANWATKFVEDQICGKLSNKMHVWGNCWKILQGDKEFPV